MRLSVDPLGLLPTAARVGVRALERALETRTAVAAAEAIARSASARRGAQVALALLEDAAAPIADRVLASAEFWRLVDEVAQSPALAEAIARQGAGFADQMADEVGERTRRADAGLERAARRILHREPRPSPGGGPFPRPQAS
jgi:hypothetical protein